MALTLSQPKQRFRTLFLVCFALILSCIPWRQHSTSPQPTQPGLHVSSLLPSKYLNLPPAPGVPVKSVVNPEKPASSLANSQLPQSEQASLWKAFSEARRQVEPLTPAQAALPFNQGVRLFAQNPGQQLTARYLDQGVRIQSGQKGADWQATFSASNLPQATSITTSGTQVEYQRGSVIEWFDNKPEGIEQGFIVTAPLAKDGELRVNVDVEGLTASAGSDHTTIQLSNDSNQSLLSYSKLLAWDATGKPLPARMEASPNGIALIVADAGASYPVTIDPIITTLEHKLAPQVSADKADHDFFGTSVSISGNYALIGTPGEEGIYGSDAGVAYVFFRSGLVWNIQAKLTASDAAGGDSFGTSVSLSDNSAIVGSPYDDNGNGMDAGSAYVFACIDTTWSQQAKLTASDGAASDNFGTAVSFSGNSALVGSSNDDDNGSESGSAYVFTRVFTQLVDTVGDPIFDTAGNPIFDITWGQEQKLLASDGAAADNFGTSVSLYVDSAIIGSPQDENANGTDAGSSYIYTRNGSSWSQQAKLIAGDGATSDNFGISVSLYDNSVLIGADQDDGSRGSAYVFTRSGISWSQQAKLAAPGSPPSLNFGFSVSLYGDSALIGSPYESVFGSYSGSAYVFTRVNSSWSFQSKLIASDGPTARNIGYSVSLDGNSALIGTRYDSAIDNSSGSAYVFTRSGALWTQQQKLTASTSVGNDGSSAFFGSSVSRYGDSALVGAKNENTSAGVVTGSAYVFIRSGYSWSLQAKLIASDADFSNIFGASVSLYADSALIGAPNNIDNGIRKGSAYVFIRNGTTWSQQAKLNAADGAAGDLFGSSVSLYNNSALVGSPNDDDTGNNSGSSYVFTRNGTTWSQQTKLNAGDGAAGDLFGSSVSLYDNSALVGSPNDDDTGNNSGSSYVFTRNGTTWSQQTKLNAGDGAAGDLFGSSVSLYDNSALVGSPYDDDNGSNSGSAYVFSRTGITWSQQAKLNAADGAAGDLFGSSVSLYADSALVGSPNDDDNGSNSGSAYAFSRTVITWSQQAKLKGVDGAADDLFGSSVSLYADSALVGSPEDDQFSLLGQRSANQGTVYIFRLIPAPNPDTDNDLASDSWETANGFNSNLTNDYKTLDSDHDGDRDLIEIFQGTGRALSGEYYLGMRNVAATVNSTLQQLKTTYRRSTTQTTIHGTIRWSTDLVNWYAPGVDNNGVRVLVSETVVSSGTGYEIVEVTATITPGNPGRLFLTLALSPLQ